MYPEIIYSLSLNYATCVVISLFLIVYKRDRLSFWRRDREDEEEAGGGKPDNLIGSSLLSSLLMALNQRGASRYLNDSVLVRGRLITLVGTNWYF